MKKHLIAIAGLSAICSLPLSAREIRINESFSLDEVHTIVLSQTDLNPITIGINVVPITTSIGTWPGEELSISIRGSSFLGTAGKPELRPERNAGLLSVEMGYRSSFKAGLRIGKIDIEIRIPESYQGSLELREMKSPTEMNRADLENLYIQMRDNSLNLNNVRARYIELESKGLSKTTCSSVSAGQWRVKTGSGAFIARELIGPMELDSFDGRVDISFAQFQGHSRIQSGGGDLYLRLPEESSLSMDLVSKMETARCEFPLVGEVNQQSKGRKRGRIGEEGTDSLFAQSRFGKVRVLKKEGGIE